MPLSMDGGGLPKNFWHTMDRPDEPPPLLVDAMLGRLCKWLRLIGYDAVYANHWPDAQIAACARAEGRLVLTRDRQLSRHKAIRCLLIDSQKLTAQLRQVMAALGAPSPRQPRCPQCNTLLINATHEQARPYVPEYVWQTQRRFTYCPRCDHYYWPGTHWQHVQSMLEQVKANRGDDAPDRGFHLDRGG